MTVYRENPRRHMLELDGRWYCEHRVDDEWIHIGYAPSPKGSWQTFWHHFHHGMLMRYGIFRVVAWSWANRNSFAEWSPADE